MYSCGEKLKSGMSASIDPAKEDDPALLSGVNFQLTLALLWVMSTLLNLPVFMSWVRNASATLPHDPSLLHTVILCASLSVLWQNDGCPNVKKKHYGTLATALNGIAILISMYATITQYRVAYGISAAFVLVTVHQLFAPTSEDDPDETVVVTAQVQERVAEVLETSQSPQPPGSPRVQLAVPSGSQSQESSSDSEYEYQYHLSVGKKKVGKGVDGTGRAKSALSAADTGFGEEEDGPDTE